MSSRKIQPNMEDQSLDAIDELIRWALLAEVAGEEPSPQVWQNIQAKLKAHSRATLSPSGVKRSWQRFASVLQAWAWGVAPPFDANWDYRLVPRERSYLIWRHALPLSMMPMTTMIIY